MGGRLTIQTVVIAITCVPMATDKIKRATTELELSSD